MLLRLIAAIVVAATGLGAGVPFGHAATTTAEAAGHGYDHPATFARVGDRNPVHPAASPTLLAAGIESVFAPVGLVTRAGVAAEEGTTLFHYTSEAGEQGIRATGQLNASTAPLRARYGPGQYLTDIGPESGLTRAQVARRLFGSPVAGGRNLDRCLEINVCGLPVQSEAPNIVRIPGTEPLDITGRIVRSFPGPR